MNDFEIIQLCCSFRIPAGDSRWTLLQEKKQDMNEKLCSFVAALPRWYSRCRVILLHSRVWAGIGLCR